MSETLKRVAHGIQRAAYVNGLDPIQDDDAMVMAIGAMGGLRNPPDEVIAAVESKAEERYNAAPAMQRWYGDEVWNAGVDAALKAEAQ